MDYRDKIYKSYLKNHFAVNSDEAQLEKKYKLLHRYYKKNHLKYLPLDKESTGLDIGCGTGEFIKFLTSIGYKNVLGIDNSKECVSFCKNKKYNVKKANAETFLKSNPNKYDFITFNDIMEHLTKEEVFSLLEATLKALKKNGIVLIKVPNMANPITGITGRYLDFTHEIGFTESSLATVLRTIGFANTKIKGTDIYVTAFPPLNFVAKISSKIISKIIYCLSALFGRTSHKIFTNHIIGIAKK